MTARGVYRFPCATPMALIASIRSSQRRWRKVIERGIPAKSWWEQAPQYRIGRIHPRALTAHLHGHSDIRGLLELALE